MYPQFTVIKAESKSGGATWGGVTESTKIVTNLGTAICDATLSAETKKFEEEPLPLSITELTFAKCTITVAGESLECSVGGESGNANNTPYGTTLQANGGGEGSLTITSGSGANPGLTTVCMTKKGVTVVSCTFSKGPPLALAFQGGAPMGANIEVNELSLERAGTKCPSTAKWTAKYFVTTPNEEIFATN
jgi:hypothetical protein